MSTDLVFMARAIELAANGQGFVEPNPMVGAVIVQNDQIVGEGWHQRYGSHHAEVEAIRAAGDATRGSTLYVTLEPCCHFGKTPPCTDAVIQAGVSRVVIAMRDPFPAVAGGGIRRLLEAGIVVDVGTCEAEARQLNLPYLKLIEQRRPWVLAKWAMSLDGKIATFTNDSRWISNEASRAIVHRIRGRMDAIVVGIGTALADDPLLNARPPGPRSATRIVLDSSARLPIDSQLVKSATLTPVVVVVGPAADAKKCEQLKSAGCEVLQISEPDSNSRVVALLNELGRRRMTNVLVEGGAKVLGSFHDQRLIDEFHVFIAPKVIGGERAPAAIAGRGTERICDAISLDRVVVEQLGDNIYMHGRTAKS